MKLLATIFLIFCVGGVIAKSVKKSTEDAAVNPTQLKPTQKESLQIETNQQKKLKPVKLKSLKNFSKKVPHQPPAIIAIEIVDPNDNSTKSKTSKRTIQSALGYGVPSANSYGVTDKPKLVFYKYSQQDIPPYQGHHQTESNQGYSQNNNVLNYNNNNDNQNYNNNQNSQQIGNYQVQKSIRYDLGTTQHVEYPKQNYEPTTLFATLNPQGQVGGFSQNAPIQGHNAPIILLRVYTNQLGGAIYPNLPDNHPYVGLNNVNLHNMLNNFFDKHFYQQPNNQLTNIQQSNIPQANIPQANIPQVNIQQSNIQQSNIHQSNIQQSHIDQSNLQQYQDISQNYQTNQQNYQNYQPQAQPLYTHVQNPAQDYYLNQPNQYHQQYQDNVHQYQYNQQFDYDGLPTHENYPSNDHTRVIFHPNKVTGKDVQQPQTLPEKTVKYQQPQSYSSFQFHNHQQQQNQQQSKTQDYDDYDYSQYPSNQDYSLKQNQDDQGYYYYKPDIQQILENIKGGKVNYQTIQQDYQGNQQNYQGNQNYQANQNYQDENQQDYQDSQNYQGIQQDYQPNENDYQGQSQVLNSNYGSKQNYPTSQAEYQSQTEISGTLNDKGQVDTQKVVTPHNYHAHPNGSNSKGNKKRTVRRPENTRRINTPKIKNKEE